MVQAIEDRSHRTRHVGEVANPAGLLPDRPVDLDPHAERMSVETGAFVTRRHVRETMRGLERELLEDLHDRTPGDSRASAAPSWIVSVSPAALSAAAEAQAARLAARSCSDGCSGSTAGISTASPSSSREMFDHTRSCAGGSAGPVAIPINP